MYLVAGGARWWRHSWAWDLSHGHRGHGIQVMGICLACWVLWTLDHCGPYRGDLWIRPPEWHLGGLHVYICTPQTISQTATAYLIHLYFLGL